MHTRNILSLLAAAALCTVAQAQVSVFTDSFTNLSNWTTSVSAGDGGASVVGGVAILTNDASGTTNLAGRVSIVTATSAFSNGFDQVLSNNAGDTTWTFNMRQIRSDPAGFGAASYGVGFVLGSTSSNLFTGGNGYAVVLGQSGSTDAVRLVSFTGGLAGTLTNIITATAPLADVGADYLSLQVGYNSTTNLWSLFGRNDGASTFTAPATGSLSALGTATNTTYTSATLTHMGAYWGYSTAANQTASFDNVSVAISAIPEPSTYAAIFGGLALVGAVVYRRRQAKA